MNDSRFSTWTGPAPVRPDASMTTRRLIDLVNLVPPARWVSDEDLALAYSARYGKPMTVHKLAGALLPDQQASVADWALPCHRLRLADGRPISRKYGILGSDDDFNRMFEAENGEVRDGAATRDCHFDLLTAVRTSGSRRQER
ncbi:hypothetical protein [Ilumatobacter nonamiensis]|uniref:hypothetical protein n=1 Tax=Ilumatobacter nonamiensis TaxID=467093 RepID=UPI00058BD48E|nr:hypothetical protein [Ilumatobacter nonamiensis]